MRVVVGLMLGLVLLAAGAARADLAYREDLMRKGYFVCLARAGDEDLCLNRFGRLMWYPRDAEECEGIGARVEKVIALGGEPKWRDLFKNERCARRGLPHSVEAVNAGEKQGPDSQWERCIANFGYRPNCREKYGNHLWYPHKEGTCPREKKFLAREMKEYWAKRPEKRRAPYWYFFFQNERCWRLGREFHEPRLPR